MGGGASSNSDGAMALQESEELLTCSLLLGRAIAALTFPDMYRIQDFHSEDAPELESRKRTNRTEREMFAALFEDGFEDFGNEIEGGADRLRLTAGAEEDTPMPDDEEEFRRAEEFFNYKAHFMVIVGSDKIVLKDVTSQNEDGWTALQSCCHSHTAVSAGLAIIEEMKQRDCGFEQRTLRGPGTHNAGWTALHMAAAYGVEPLVFQLLRAGAAPNCRNSLDWAPLNEAAHRGFTPIIQVGGRRVVGVVGA